METIFDVIFAFVVVGLVGANIFYVRKFKEARSILLDIHIRQNDADNTLNCILHKIIDHDVKNEQILSDLHKSIVDCSAALEKVVEFHPMNQARKNNWDNIKEAFRGPSRLENSERT